MIHVKSIRVSNGSRTKWVTYDKTVSDLKSLEILRTLNKIHHKAKAVDFVFVEK